jgi:hypothetical protein
LRFLVSLTRLSIDFDLMRFHWAESRRASVANVYKTHSRRLVHRFTSSIDNLCPIIRGTPDHRKQARFAPPVMGF